MIQVSLHEKKQDDVVGKACTLDLADIGLRSTHNIKGLRGIKEMCGSVAANLTLEGQESMTHPYRQVNKTRAFEQRTTF